MTQTEVELRRREVGVHQATESGVRCNREGFIASISFILIT